MSVDDFEVIPRNLNGKRVQVFVSPGVWFEFRDAMLEGELFDMPDGEMHIVDFSHSILWGGLSRSERDFIKATYPDAPECYSRYTRVVFEPVENGKEEED